MLCEQCRKSCEVATGGVTTGAWVGVEGKDCVETDGVGKQFKAGVDVNEECAQACTYAGGGGGGGGGCCRLATVDKMTGRWA